MNVLFSILNNVLGNQVLGRIIMLGIDWFLTKNKTDRESRELAVSLAMSLRRQGVTDVSLSFDSDLDAKRAADEWSKIEDELKAKKENEK